MTTAWVPPPRSYHLRIFAISLVLVVAALAAFLFAVHLEAISPATGIISARDLTEIRAPMAGLIEPGWYEGEIAQPEGPPLRVRVDHQGQGSTDPEGGPVQTIWQYELGTGRRRIEPRRLRYHRLESGDELWPGQVLGCLRPVEPRVRLDSFDPRPVGGEAEPSFPIDLFRPDRLGRLPASLRVPANGAAWLAVQVKVVPSQAVQPGDVIATLVSIDPETHRPRDLIARLELDEKHWGEVAVGQKVRLSSTMHNPRLHGQANGVIDRLEPWGEPGPNGRCQFHAIARITDAPFPLWLGSSVQADVVLGRKLVYRIILEN